MAFSFDTAASPFVRRYDQLNESVGFVTVNEFRIQVPHNPFWKKFACGWEPETERIYQRFVLPGSTVLDIGAWIGPTILFALACGAGRIVALEPNPGSFRAIESIIKDNPILASRIELIGKAVSDKSGIVSMGLPPGEMDTSTSSLSGNDFEAKAVSLVELQEKFDAGNISLIKIDIEGAEAMLGDGLSLLAARKYQAIHLSLHVPCFPAGTDTNHFIRSLSGFDIFDDRGTYLSHKALSERINTTNSHPEWGTRHGNYFEVLLLPR